MPGNQAWSARYDLGFTPWDLGAPHPELVRRLAEDPSLGVTEARTAYVPGCGSGHDAAALAASGWDVTAVDFAASVEPELRRRLEPFDAHVHIGDALGFRSAAAFDLIFDHTFFCAIDPSERSAFGDMVERLLGADGTLISIVYPLEKPVADGGPPWGIDAQTISGALGPTFAPTFEGSRSTVAGRRWPHMWVEWKRI